MPRIVRKLRMRWSTKELKEIFTISRIYIFSHRLDSD
jgi:hypothetical protein